MKRRALKGVDFNRGSGGDLRTKRLLTRTVQSRPSPADLEVLHHQRN